MCKQVYKIVAYILEYMSNATKFICAILGAVFSVKFYLRTALKDIT